VTLPDDATNDVLLELGRLVWAALNLEDVVYTVCRSIQPRHGQFDVHPISDRIREALSDLEKRPDDALRAKAAAWLTEAKAALDERNAVIHSTPVVPFDTSGSAETFQAGDPSLMHFRRNKRNDRVLTPLTVESLQRVRVRLQEARPAWADLAPALWASRLAAPDA
jgi:hypothetical protein